MIEDKDGQYCHLELNQSHSMSKGKGAEDKLRNRDKQHERRKFVFIVENKRGKNSLLQNILNFSLVVS